MLDLVATLVREREIDHDGQAWKKIVGPRSRLQSDPAHLEESRGDVEVVGA